MWFREYIETEQDNPLITLSNVHAYLWLNNTCEACRRKPNSSIYKPCPCQSEDAKEALLIIRELQQINTNPHVILENAKSHILTEFARPTSAHAAIRDVLAGKKEMSDVIGMRADWTDLNRKHAYEISDFTREAVLMEPPVYPDRVQIGAYGNNS